MTLDEAAEIEGMLQLLAQILAVEKHEVDKVKHV